MRATLGLLYDYPSGRPDTLEVVSDRLPTDGWAPYPVTTRWVPDAFLGPMASVLAAVSGAQRRSRPPGTTSRRLPWSKPSTGRCGADGLRRRRRLVSLHRSDPGGRPRRGDLLVLGQVENVYLISGRRRATLNGTMGPTTGTTGFQSGGA